jgi:hypothetical protein
MTNAWRLRPPSRTPNHQAVIMSLSDEDRRGISPFTLCTHLKLRSFGAQTAPFAKDAPGKRTSG